MAWVAAAYAVVLLTFAGYAASLVGRERALRRELAQLGSSPVRGPG
jgi:hypothetical protein